MLEGRWPVASTDSEPRTEGDPWPVGAVVGTGLPQWGCRSGPTGLKGPHCFQTSIQNKVQGVLQEYTDTCHPKR